MAIHATRFVRVAIAFALAACGGVRSSARDSDAAALSDSGSLAKPDSAATPSDSGPGADATNHDAGMGDAASNDGEPPDGPSSSPDGGAWSPLCPETAPAIGSSCSIPTGTFCEYGDTWWDIGCDILVRCFQGTWFDEQPFLETCVPAPGPNPAACPATDTSIVTGASCPAEGLTCLYGEGAECQCTSTHDAAPVWECTPAPGCPSTRPRVGTACATSPGTLCTYNGSCSGESCSAPVGGVWGYAIEVCQ